MAAALTDTPCTTLYAGLSGGADSTALLLALQAWRERCEAAGEATPQLVALHVNHGLDGAAEAWEGHCGELCARLNVPLRVHAASVSRHGNLEANARAARYGFFATQVQRDEALVLAHHREDQLETLLLKLLQGRGMVAMATRGRVQGMTVLRPFLSLAKRALVAYVTTRDTAWVEDASNADESFDRNYLRARVLPALLARWPDAPQRLRVVAEQSGAVREALVGELAARPDRVPLSKVPVARAAAVAWLQAYVAARGHHQVTRKALEDFWDSVRAGQRARCGIDPGAELRVERDHIVYRKEAAGRGSV